MKKFFIFATAATFAITSCNDTSKNTTATNAADSLSPVTTDKPAETPDAPPDSAAMMKAWESYMTPGEQHKMLASNNGTWIEETKMYMSPDAPPETMTGTAENSMMLNGLYQKSVHKGMYGKMPFEGVSTLAYNNASKKFQSTWVDNMGSGIMTMEGTWDDATKTLNMKGMTTDPMTGKEMAVRETWKIIDDKNQYMEMFDTKNGKEMKTMEIKMTKK